jgi:hypothetical protein
MSGRSSLFWIYRASLPARAGTWANLRLIEKFSKKIPEQRQLRAGFFSKQKKYESVQLPRSNSLSMKDLHTEMNNSK